MKYIIRFSSPHQLQQRVNKGKWNEVYDSMKEAKRELDRCKDEQEWRGREGFKLENRNRRLTDGDGNYWEIFPATKEEKQTWYNYINS